MKIETSRSGDLAGEIRGVFPAPPGWCVSQYDQADRLVGHQAVACWAVMDDGTVEPMTAGLCPVTALQLVDLQDRWSKPGWGRRRQIEFVGEQELLRRLAEKNLLK